VLWVHDVGGVEECASLIQAAARLPDDERAGRARALAEAEFSIERCAARIAELVPTLVPAPADGRGANSETLQRIVAVPVAAQRIARLWAAGRYVRPGEDVGPVEASA
jgi:hypothetical protein